MKSKIKPNRYKSTDSGKKPGSVFSGASIDFCLKWIMTVAVISVLSIGAVFAYDLVTQSSLFAVETIDISGNNRVTDTEIIQLAELTRQQNILKLNMYTIENKIAAHPWISAAHVKRDMASRIVITVTEHEALAIVRIENISDILINKQGKPFKEYDPQADQLDFLPVITGLDLTRSQSGYQFKGPLLNMVLEFMNMELAHMAVSIRTDADTGITIDCRDIYNKKRHKENPTIPLKMGFDNYKKKMKRAKTISEYIDTHFPDRVITAIDLFAQEKVLVKTKLIEADSDVSKKGV